MTLRVLNPRQSEPTLKGWHVAAVAAAFFGTIFAVNGVLLFQAISTHSGLVANEPYRKGLAYNDRIAAGERQQALGWTEVASIVPGAIRVELSDGSGRPVRGLALTGTLGRPSTVRHDRQLAFAETAPGVYSAAARPESGAWLLSLEARADAAAELVYRSKRRLWQKP